jgi:hypothetical protein
MDLGTTQGRFAAMRMGVAVRTPLGFERRNDRTYRQTQASHHIRQHMIRRKTQTIGHQLNCNMAITEVISRFRDDQRVCADGFEKRLIGRDNLDIPAIGQPHTFAVSKHPAALDDERRLLAVFQPQQQSALASLIKGETGPQWHRGAQNRKYR